MAKCLKFFPIRIGGNRWYVRLPLWRVGDWEELGGSGAGQVLLFDLGTGYTGVFTT